MAAAGDWESVESGSEGTAQSIDIVDAYVDRLVEGFAGGAFRVGWDAGNGAAGTVIEKLTARLPGEHHLLFTDIDRSEEHTSELQSLMRISYAVFSLKKKNTKKSHHNQNKN